VLDPALLRPGRFDRHVTVSEPDYQGRLAILTLHASKRPLGPDVDLEYLAHRSPGFTGADLANVANEAALLAIREGKKLVEMTHFEEAIQRVIAGPQRRGHLMTDEERARLSYHESGHALVSASLGHNLEVHRISIVARGRGLGQSALAGQDSDRMLFTRTELLDQMVVAMGGTAAEELLFHEPSTTAEKDIEKVTDLARQVIGRYGMSTQLGPVRLMSKDLDIYLGGEAHSLVTVAPMTLEEFDREVRKTVEFAKQRATDICVENRKHLDKLASTLMEAETLEGPRLEALLAPLKPVAKPAPPAKSNGGNGATRARTRKPETSGTAPAG
jgi:cell division protease FtsH